MRTFRSLLCASATVLALAVTIGAQTVRFEVASIKPSNPNPTGPLGATPFVLPALGRLTAQNTSLRMLVMAAYQKQPFQIVGGPPWFNSDKFEREYSTDECHPYGCRKARPERPGDTDYAHQFYR